MTPEQELTSRIAKTVFRLNGQLLSDAEGLARPLGLTAAWWQVLGTVLYEPRPVAEIAREVGVTRQSVQRIADILVDQGLAEYRPNPAHRRAKLLRPTHEGYDAIRRIGPAHAVLADRVARQMGFDQLHRLLELLTRYGEVLATLAADSSLMASLVAGGASPSGGTLGPPAANRSPSTTSNR